MMMHLKEKIKNAFKRKQCSEIGKLQTRNLEHNYFPTSSEWSQSQLGSGEKDSFHLRFHCEVSVHVGIWEVSVCRMISNLFSGAPRHCSADGQAYTTF
jgi:hypothetical protein